MELLRLVNMVHPMKARMMDMVPQQRVLIVDTARQRNMVLPQKVNLTMEIRALMTILLKLHETDEKISSSERAEKIIEMEEGKIRKITEITEITGGRIIEIEEDGDYRIEIGVVEPVLWMMQQQITMQDQPQHQAAMDPQVIQDMALPHKPQ